MQHRKHVPEVHRDGRLAREQRVDALLQLEEDPVDVVVEGDHLVRELDVALGKSVDAPRSERSTSSPSRLSDCSSCSIPSWSEMLMSGAIVAQQGVREDVLEARLSQFHLFVTTC